MARPPPDDEPRGKCPICGRPSVRDYRPFCSRRCADVDLLRWLRGAYVIPERPEDKEGSTTPPASRHDDDEPGRN